MPLNYYNSIKYSFLLLVLFSVILLFLSLTREDTSFKSTWINSYLKMHSSLTAKKSDTQLIVIHDNYSELTKLMQLHPSMMEIQKTKFSNIALLSIKGEIAPIVTLLRESSFVRFVSRNQLIFFCH